MSWRKRMYLWTGPGMLGGITHADWFALLRENHFAIDPPYWWRAAVITLRSTINSFGCRCEERLHGDEFPNAAIAPPVFLLGIWRSGTTLLQNLFAQDQRLAFPNWFEATYPHQFLHTEHRKSRLEGFFVPRTRLQDSMRFGFDEPAEEEFALCTMTGLSPLLSWVFPRRAEEYDRYLTFRNVPASEVNRWKEAMRRFIQKLSWKYQRPLVLKSPAQTARIPLLLDLFPDARFVHIFRNPYDVYQSARHTNLVVMRYVTLQRLPSDVDERIIRQYSELFDAFFTDKELIAKNKFHELRFEDLERDPVGQMREVYRALNLPGFSDVEPALWLDIERITIRTFRRFRKLASPVNGNVVFIRGIIQSNETKTRKSMNEQTNDPLPSTFDDGDVYDLVLGDLPYGLDFYVNLAREAQGPILDVACGTGRILLPCLQAGVDIEGVDLFEAMLNRLRAKATALGLSPRLHQFDMSDFSLPRRFALIMIPFNAFIHNMTQEAQISCLERCREHLLPGGELVFDTFFPSLEIIGAPQNTRVLEGEFPHPQTGLPIRMYDTRSFDRVVQVQHSVNEIELLAAEGSVQRTYRSEIRGRYVYRHEMELLLRVAGFARWEIHGNFEGRPLTREEDAMIVKAWNE